ncbi:hypothetical protein Tcan_18068 [Toxocara canis]|uniref:PDZ domain-containing protein n=1 Tax=Toxocara canis TaxID=6265 RepID=A0A0B2V798_TOXCA|nr:hypothetical protein Tcan_18068 [Toxocara canis]
MTDFKGRGTERIDVSKENGQNPRPRLRISRNLQVLRVHESSLAANRLDPGDVVRKVNGKTVESRKEFYQLMSDIAKDPDCQAVRIDIKRPRRQQKLSKKEIFVELPKAFEILPGYDYFLGYMTVFPGCKIGIHIKSYNQKVKSVIERPSTPATFRFANYALQYSKKSEIDPKMADDVIEICKREIVFWRGSRTPIARPSILRRKTQYQEAQQKSTVAIATKSTEIGIACEAVNPQWLQSVPERCTGDEYEKVTEWVANRRVAKPSPTDSRSKRKRAKGKGVSKKSFRTRRQP